MPILCLTITTSSNSNFLAGSTLVTQEIPVRVLPPAAVENIHEPKAPDANVHIYLPPLQQLRALTDRMNKLSSLSLSSEHAFKLTLAANMAGEFRMGVKGSEVAVESRWQNLENPVLIDADPSHPNTMRDKTRWEEVRVDGREWAKVLKVAPLAKRVVACWCQGRALVLYVFLADEGEEDETVLIYYMSSYTT